MAFSPKTVCRVTSRRGESLDIFRFENENAKCFTVFAELADTIPLYHAESRPTNAL